MLASAADSKYRFDNMDKDKVKEIAHKGNAASNAPEARVNKSKAAILRHFRNKNPDIAALMQAYKSHDSLFVMEKYVADNEKFMTLFTEADTPDGKRKILRDYMDFQMKMFELIFGSKQLIATTQIEPLVVNIVNPAAVNDD